MERAEIKMKLPSLNDYVNICRRNRYESASFKKKIERQISRYIDELPAFEKPVTIHFHWIEKDSRRDLDNIAFAKKFILDAMVKSGKLADDNRKFVTAFTDTFEKGKETEVVIFIEEEEQ